MNACMHALGNACVYVDMCAIICRCVHVCVHTQVYLLQMDTKDHLAHLDLEAPGGVEGRHACGAKGRSRGVCCCLIDSNCNVPLPNLCIGSLDAAKKRRMNDEIQAFWRGQAGSLQAFSLASRLSFSLWKGDLSDYREF